MYTFFLLPRSARSARVLAGLGLEVGLGVRVNPPAPPPPLPAELIYVMGFNITYTHLCSSLFFLLTRSVRSARALAAHKATHICIER